MAAEVSRAQVCTEPALSATNVWPPPTSAGWFVSLPCPLLVERPQHQVEPSNLMAQVWSYPADMAEKAWSPETGTGATWSLFSELPSWPSFPACRLLVVIQCCSSTSMLTCAEHAAIFYSPPSNKLSPMAVALWRTCGWIPS